MKPTKNHVYCAACGRTKMLFSEQGKADNFIRFNSADIKREKGYCPVRSYYCTYCAGWHITSNSSEEAAKYFETRDEMRMTMYRESRSGISKQEKRTLFRAKFTEICSHIDMLLSMGDISAVEASIDAYKEAEQLLGNSQRSPKADKLEEVIGYVGEAMRLPEEMRQAYLNRLPEEADTGEQPCKKPDHRAAEDLGRVLQSCLRGAISCMAVQVRSGGDRIQLRRREAILARKQQDR